MLKVSNLNSSYGQIHVLWDVNIEVFDRSITGMIGPNGTGKSTLLKTILGVVRAQSGSIEFDGARIENLQTKDIVRKGIVYVPEGRRTFPEMTVLENLKLGVTTRQAKLDEEKNLANVFKIFPILEERKHQLAGTFSGGELQLLAIARGLMGAPSLLLIDEPSLGLSPIAISTVFRTIEEINALGKTILIVEQNVPRLLKLASYTYVLENGRIFQSGPSADLEKSDYIARSYLGVA